MQISNQQLKKFAEIYKREFGKEISLEEAREIIFRLLSLMRLLSKPLPLKKECEAHQESDRLPMLGRDLDTETSH
jgi:hypothetical protein